MAMNLFGLNVEDREIRAVIDDLITRTKIGEKLMVVTPNVDHFLRWQSDSTFRQLYEYANFRLLDGMPLLWLARILGNKSCKRITGVDISLELLSEANRLGIPIAIIGGTLEVLEKASKNLAQQYPNLDLFLTESPGNVQLQDERYLDHLSQLLASKDVKIVLLCLGSPKQEKLFVDLSEISTLTGTYLCVGATVDFISGVKIRAPKFIQNLGLEWGFRFIQEPNRLFKRYFLENSRIIKFLVLAVLIKLKIKRNYSRQIKRKIKHK